MTGSLRRDDGSIAPAVPLIAVMLFVLAGLVIDSSRLLNARGRAVAYAEEAARAGSQQIDLGTDAVRLDPAQAEQAVDDYCRAAATGDTHLVSCAATTVTPTQVSVATSFQIPTGLLGLVGVHQLTASGQGEATSQQGVTGVDTYPSVPPPSRVVTQVPLPFPTGRPDPSATFTPLPLCPPTPSTPTPSPPTPTPPTPSPAPSTTTPTSSTSTTGIVSAAAATTPSASTSGTTSPAPAPSTPAPSTPAPTTPATPTCVPVPSPT